MSKRSTQELAVTIALIVIIVILLFVNARAADRCNDYRSDVRRSWERYFGVDSPWWYGLAQLKQESRCRATITAFDGGQGIAQFMPKTAAAVGRQMGVPFDPYQPTQAIRAQTFFLSGLQKQNPAPRSPLWPTFQAYNGGWGLLKVEAARAGGWNRDAMRQACHRKVLVLKSGPLDLCAVNYSYPELIHRYANSYRTAPDSKTLSMW